MHRRSHPADRRARSAPASVRRKNADIRVLPSYGDSVCRGAHGHVHQRCRRLDVVQPSTAEHSKNRSTLVRYLSPAAPHPKCPLCVCADNIKPGKYVRDLEIYIDSDTSKTHVSRTVSSCFASLRHIHVYAAPSLSPRLRD